jgi:hypothetical protein
MPQERLPMRKIRDVLRLKARGRIQAQDRREPRHRSDGGRGMHPQGAACVSELAAASEPR